MVAGDRKHVWFLGWGEVSGELALVLTELSGHVCWTEIYNNVACLPYSLTYLYIPWHYLIPFTMIQATIHHPGLFWRKIMCRVTFQHLTAEDILSFLYPHLTQDSSCPDPIKNRGKGRFRVTSWTPTETETHIERERGSASLSFMNFKMNRGWWLLCLNSISEQEGVGIISQRLSTAGRNRFI